MPKGLPTFSPVNDQLTSIKFQTISFIPKKNIDRLLIRSLFSTPYKNSFEASYLFVNC